MSIARPPESWPPTLTLLAALLVLVGLTAASRWVHDAGVARRPPCQNTGHAPCR